jgi:hypothetical protein
VRFRRLLALAALASCVLAVPARFVAAEDPPASKKPQSRPASSPKAPQTQPAPAPAAQSQSQGGVTVLENYYLDLPGFDLSTLTPRQKKKFLDRVNAEFCTCGCAGDTIARCIVNDPTCKVARGLAEKILSEVKAGK